jgi:hypothetical protein
MVHWGRMGPRWSEVVIRIRQSYVVASDEQILNDEQRKIMLLVLDSFRSNPTWPTYRWLNQIAFVEHDLEFDSVYKTLPPRAVLPDPARRINTIWRPEDEVSLTLNGLVLLREQAELDAFLATVRELGSRAARFVPPRLANPNWSSEAMRSPQRSACARGTRRSLLRVS